MSWHSFELLIIVLIFSGYGINCQRKPRTKRIPISDRPRPVHNFHLSDHLKTLRYSFESASNSGISCISDCVENFCLTESGTIEECTVPKQKKPSLAIYFTSGYYDDEVCYGKCSTGGKTYHWCYVDEAGYWDYCNPNFENVLVNKYFGSTPHHYYYELPCVDGCTNIDDNNRHYCYLSGVNNWDYCDPSDPVDYPVIISSTTHRKCIGICSDHRNKVYKWCHTDDSSWDYCADNAIMRSNFCPAEARNDVNQILNYAREMEYNSRNIVVNGSSISGPINSYTYRDLGNGLRLPLVIRAVLHSEYLKASNSRKGLHVDADAKKNCEQMNMILNQASTIDNDQFGQLIAYTSGGCGEFFNVIPQSFALNVGRYSTSGNIAPSMWRTSEMNHEGFLKKNNQNGFIDVVIVIFYDLSTSLRPTHVGLYEYYFDDNSESAKCGIIISNDPKNSDK